MAVWKGRPTPEGPRPKRPRRPKKVPVAPVLFEFDVLQEGEPI